MILEIQQGFKNIHSWDTDWLCSNAQLKWVYLHAEFLFPKKNMLHNAPVVLGSFSNNDGYSEDDAL